MQRLHESWFSDHHHFSVCKKTLEMCTPRKKTYLRVNKSPLINKIISRTIMDEIAGSDQKICHSLDKYFLSIASNLNYTKTHWSNLKILKI